MNKFLESFVKVLIILCFVSCAADDEGPNPEVQEIAIEEVRGYAKGEAVFYQLTTFAEELWKVKNDTACDFESVTIASVLCNEDTVWVDFGSKGIIDADGYRKGGEIQFVFDGKYQEVGAKCTYSLTDFYKDTIAVEGTNVLTFLEGDTLQMSLSSAELAFDADEDITWKSTRKRVIQDEIAYFYGTTEGTSSDNIAFVATIDENTPEQISTSCDFAEPVIVQGITDFTFTSGLEPRQVDFGNGACDQLINVQIGILNIEEVLE